MKTSAVRNMPLGHFCTVTPINGLMVAEHKKDHYEKGDTVVELFCMAFGRKPEFGLLGGFENGVNVIALIDDEISDEQIQKFGIGSEDSHCIARSDKVVVCKNESVFNGTTCFIYVIATSRGVIYASLIMNQMSKAEAAEFEKLFASAQPFDA